MYLSYSLNFHSEPNLGQATKMEIFVSTTYDYSQQLTVVIKNFVLDATCALDRCDRL